MWPLGAQSLRTGLFQDSPSQSGCVVLSCLRCAELFVVSFGIFDFLEVYDCGCRCGVGTDNIEVRIMYTIFQWIVL
jgi:hypothetical protein